LAVTPPNNEAFFREVDEELRRDRTARLWKQWGVWIVVAILALLAAFGGWLYWQHRQTQQAGVEGEQLQAAYDALAAGNASAAAAPLTALSGSRSDAYRALAAFTQADILLQKKDMKGAAAKFAGVAADGSIAQPFRDLALIRQTVAEFDAVKPQVVVDRLRPLAVPGSAWLGSGGELVAIAYLKMGRPAEAGQMFARIAADKDVPETIRQRAVQMASVSGGEAPSVRPDAKQETIR
jgi:hypothetical protein